MQYIPEPRNSLSWDITKPRNTQNRLFCGFLPDLSTLENSCILPYVLQSHTLPKASATGNQRPNARCPLIRRSITSADATVNSTATLSAAGEVGVVFISLETQSTCFEQLPRKYGEGWGNNIAQYYAKTFPLLNLQISRVPL